MRLERLLSVGLLIVTIGLLFHWCPGNVSAEEVIFTLNNSSSTQNNTDVSSRDDKFLPLFTLVKFANIACTTADNQTGTCYTKKECKFSGGTYSGHCAAGFGVCCIVSKTCGQTINRNCTYFRNTGFPGTYTGDPSCTVNINKVSSNICQLRLDYNLLEIAQPNGDGQCVTDSLNIGGTTGPVPTICGTNTGEHMYVDVPAGNGATMITIDTNMAVSATRRWNIKVTQIPCNSVTRAPSGCLMYYTGVTGVVKSFNYGLTDSTEINVAGLVGTREMRNLNYGVCVRMEANYCGIEWYQADPRGFTVSGDTGGIDPTLLGNPVLSVQGSNCDGDFIVVPNPVDSNNMALNTDRFCGNALPNITSRSKPFVMYVVTNENENNTVTMLPDSNNRGFCLNYRQIHC